MSAAAAAADKENAGANNGPGPRAFSPTELKSMLGQCLKMASENKITPQNTWQLQLIEHLPELIREEGGAQTNFQVRFLGGWVLLVLGAAVCCGELDCMSAAACREWAAACAAVGALPAAAAQRACPPSHVAARCLPLLPARLCDAGRGCQDLLLPRGQRAHRDLQDPGRPGPRIRPCRRARTCDWGQAGGHARQPSGLFAVVGD